MNKSLEDNLYRAIVLGDQHAVSQLLFQGANPNKTISHGKTCLGEAACIGNSNILKLLIDSSLSTTSNKNATQSASRKRHSKSHKRKLRTDTSNYEMVVKCKNPNDRNLHRQDDIANTDERNTLETNQGYFVFIHGDGSSSDESRITLKSQASPLTPSSQTDLEWDEDIGNVAPTTSEDETWSSMYKWYAAILECTGAAIASASMITNGIDQQDSFMRTALHYAAEQGHSTSVKLLLDSGCKVDLAASDGMTPLHLAVAKNHTDIARMLISFGSHVNYRTHDKMTPLHFASTLGNFDLVKLLVNNGASLEARETNERTPLYLSAGNGHLDVVRYLISSGANVNGEDINGYTPLCEAVWQRFASVAEVLLKSGARITHSHKLLHDAIVQGEEEIMKLLVNMGGGINLHNDNGDTPLLLAARLSEPALARILLQKGANVNAYNNITGANALHIAVESVSNCDELEEIIRCLLDFKIDMNTTALTGDTALNRALLLQKDHAALLLIRYGADVNACDLHSRGLDNLSIASRSQSIVLTDALIKAGHYVSTPTATTPVPKGAAAKWLYCSRRQPQHLIDLCRIKIRCIGKGKILHQFVESLPIPKSLKKYLMMEDIYLS